MPTQSLLYLKTAIEDYRDERFYFLLNDDGGTNSLLATEARLLKLALELANNNLIVAELKKLLLNKGIEETVLYVAVLSWGDNSDQDEIFILLYSGKINITQQTRLKAYSLLSIELLKKWIAYLLNAGNYSAFLDAALLTVSSGLKDFDKQVTSHRFFNHLTCIEALPVLIKYRQIKILRRALIKSGQSEVLVKACIQAGDENILKELKGDMLIAQCDGRYLSCYFPPNVLNALVREIKASALDSERQYEALHALKVFGHPAGPKALFKLLMQPNIFNGEALRLIHQIVLSYFANATQLYKAAMELDKAFETDVEPPTLEQIQAFWQKQRGTINSEIRYDKATPFDLRELFSQHKNNGFRTVVANAIEDIGIWVGEYFSFNPNAL